MRSLDVKRRLEELIESGKQAFDLLLEEVKKPIDPELQDDKARNAMKAKKECFMDAQEILVSINKIEKQIEGEDTDQNIDKDENSFQAGFSEKYAKK
jgi:hypothetical protein